MWPAFIGVAVLLGLLIGYLSAEFPDALQDDDNRLRLAIAVLWLVTVATVVVAQIRRGQLGAMLRYAVAWILIFLGLLTVYAFRGEFGFLKDRIVAELLPQRGAAVQPAEPGREASISFRSRQGGHFVVEARVNGADIRFMVDTGASAVVLSAADARRIGINPEALNYTERYSTANGIVHAAPVRLDRVQVGPIEVEDVRASVTRNGMIGSLLGMSFLGRLSSYEVRDGVLTFKQ